MLVIWHYNGDGRTYHNTKTQVSANGSTWASGAQLFAEVRNNNYATVMLNTTTLNWSVKAYVDTQEFYNPNNEPGSPYYSGDDYDSPTSVTLSPAIYFPGGATTYRWITTFGDVTRLTGYSFSGSLYFTWGGGSCTLPVNWGVIGALLPGVASGGERSAGQEGSGAGKALAAYPGSQLKMQTRTLRKGLLLVPPAGQVWRFYYYAGGTRVAMREATSGGETLYYLLGDHLGSTAITANSNGSKVAELRYKAWGETRYSYGTTPTKRQYTGQVSEMATIGLYFYGARFYDPSIMRWLSPDTDVPESQDGRGLDRYAYVANNPIVYQDPSGHCWGVASAIRGVPGYDTTCNNLDMALSVVQHPKASISQKAGAGAYIAAEGLAHGALALGVGALACSAVAPCATAVEAALGIGTSVWSLDTLQRGWAIEKLIGRGSLLRDLPGFPTIDRFENGIATSIKSIDLGAKTYQNIGALTTRVQG